MGAGSWSSADWAATSASRSTSAKPTVDHIFTSRHLDPLLDPKGITIRESRDSFANPNSTALIVGLDVTGSMDRVLDVMAREGLGTLVGSIYERKPISDPHIMLMGIGDFECDRSPLQITQFEAENKPLIEQMHKIYLERGGGGNAYESYSAPWLFAATKTSIDCFEKRGKKGYLFTVGDEGPTPVLQAIDLQKVFGQDSYTRNYTEEELLEMVTSTYDVFHIMVEEGSHFRRYPDETNGQWVEILGQRAIPLSDHTKLAEVIVSTLQIAEGADHDTVAKSWSRDTSLVVARATKDIIPGGSSSPGGLVLY